MSEITIEVKCLYCGEPMKEDSTTKMIKCHNCGRVNDYDEMVEKDQKQYSDDIDKQLEKMGFKKI